MFNVYKVNDFDWVAANTYEEAKGWYLKEFGAEDDECWLEEECSLDEEMWVDLSDISGEDLSEVHEIRNEMTKRSFRWVLEHIYNNDFSQPIHIASAEY